MDKDYKINNKYVHNTFDEKSDEFPPFDEYRYLMLTHDLFDGERYENLSFRDGQKMRVKVKIEKLDTLVGYI
jgi:hypothetical protein